MIRDFVLLADHYCAADVNVNATYALSWEVELPVEQVNAAATWVFRFLQAGLSPNQTTYQISSPLVVIREAGALTSSVSITPSSTPSSTSKMSTTTATSTLSAQNSSADAHSGLGSGSIAGIVVGAVIGAALLVAVGWWLARRPRMREGGSKNHEIASAAVTEQQKENHPRIPISPSPAYTHVPTYQELEHNNRTYINPPAELH